MRNATIQRGLETRAWIQERIRLIDSGMSSEEADAELDRREQEKMKSQVLTADLVVATADLFRLTLPELKALDQKMFELLQREPEQLMSQGAYYRMMFDEQRVHIAALTKFIEQHPAYSPLAQGQQLLAWLKAHNEPINAGTLNNAFVAIRGLDAARPVEKPVFTVQPQDQIVAPAEGAFFGPVAVTPAGCELQWYEQKSPNSEPYKLIGEQTNRHVAVLHEGTRDSVWFCDATNAAGKTRSNSVRLISTRHF